MTGLRWVVLTVLAMAVVFVLANLVVPKQAHASLESDQSARRLKAEEDQARALLDIAQSLKRIARQYENQKR